MLKHIKNSAAIHVVFLAIGVLVVYGTYHLLRDTYGLVHESQGIKAKIESLQKKKSELESRISELETMQAVEREAKEKLNLKLPGEEVVVVVPDEKPKEQEKRPGVIEKIKLFFHWLNL